MGGTNVTGRGRFLSLRRRGALWLLNAVVAGVCWIVCTSFHGAPIVPVVQDWVWGRGLFVGSLRNEE